MFIIAIMMLIFQDLPQDEDASEEEGNEEEGSEEGGDEDTSGPVLNKLVIKVGIWVTNAIVNTQRCFIPGY